MMMMIAICPKGQQKGCEGAVWLSVHSGCRVEEEWTEPEQAGGPCGNPGNALTGDGRPGQGTGLTALVEAGRRGSREIKIQVAKETTTDCTRGEGERGVQREAWTSASHHFLFKSHTRSCHQHWEYEHRAHFLSHQR